MLQVRPRSRRQGGFTLIELMITAAIIGVLTAIAIPQFIDYQARGRRSEAYSNLASISRAYKAYAAEKGAYPDMFVMSTEPSLPVPPGGVIGASKLTWDGTTQAYFDIVGWKSDGNVWHTYDINSVDGCTCTLCFTATAHGDVDGDTGWSALMYVHPQTDAAGNVTGECPSRVNTLTAPTRNGGSVYDEVALNPTMDRF